jgi:serine/threonine-protein kinase
MASSHQIPATRPDSALSPAPEKADIGQILLRDGIIRKEQLDECLHLQAEMAAAQPSSKAPKLGEILVQRGYATPEAVERALHEQHKTILFCPRCSVLLNVDRRPDAVGYSCGRCQGPLQAPPPGVQNRTSDSSVIINSVLPVPPEVQEIKDDPKRRFGKYIVLEQIGRGGIAEVFRAWDTYLHQYVALKRIQSLPPEETDERHSRVASLLNEAHNAIRLRHPNIVSVYDIGRVGREYYISMEYLDGRTMFDAIVDAVQRKALSPYYEDPRLWLDVLFQVAHAVHYAHTRPIPTFHCDLKPGNIFVGKEGRVCVLDFGLARQLGQFETELGVIVGTPSYMSPEQALGRNDEIDARCDVYSLGAVLYELISGRPPFVGSMYEVLRRAVNEKPVPPGLVVRHKVEGGEAPRGLAPVAPALEALCMKCLEKKREGRPENMLAVAREIEAIAKKSGVLKSVSPPSVETLSPAASGRRQALIIGTAAVFAAAAGLWFLRPGGGGAESQPVEAAFARLAEFRPEAVQADALEGRTGGEEAKRRAEAIQAFKARLLEKVNSSRPTVPELPLGTRRIKDARVTRAKLDGCVFLSGGEADWASWSELGVEGVVSLARSCGVTERPEDRFGLALFCLSAGGRKEARELLETLKGTPREQEAGPYLASLRGKE